MKATQDKKEKILKAASACFARYGYEKTTMDDIGKSVGLNKASLYYYYPNKESIFSEVIFNERTEYIKTLQESIKLKKSIRDKIVSYMTGRYRFMLEYLNLINLSSENIDQIRPFLNDLYQTVIDSEAGFLKKLIDQGIKEKQIKACDSKRVAEIIITAGDAIRQKSCINSVRRNLNVYDDERMKEEVEFLCSLILDGIMA